MSADLLDSADGEPAAPFDEETDPRIFTAEVPAGTAILFSGLCPHRSINSHSKQIRWSTDYRLHKPAAARPGKSEEDWFYGLKDSLTLRDGSSSFAADWESWANVERTAAQDEGLGVATEAFDPVVVGPWMDLWDVTEHVDGGPNKHVDRYMSTDAGKRTGAAAKEHYEHW